MICFLDSMLSLAMLELSIEISINRSMYMLNILTSKVCVEQHLNTLVYALMRLACTKFA